ncbi:MAG: SAM-dependent methyltransferase, partial [Chromatiales bacterium]|nr:SAM-dependent methyltransferase [Chromatiales bacterium]
MSSAPTIVAAGDVVPGKKASWLDRRCRRAVQTRLNGLEGGSIVISDSDGHRRIGAEGDIEVQIRIHDAGFYSDVVFEGSLGAAQSYVRGGWDSDDLTAALRLLVKNIHVVDSLEGGAARLANVLAFIRHWAKRNTRAGSAKNIEAHYDLGNELFKLFLDESMTYSSGVFLEEQSTLEDAQFEKLDRICRKLGLTEDLHVLEIGTGWGSFAV